MKTRARFNRSGRAERGAFTLIEMMVVITIMAALMALTAAAVLKFLAVQQTTNTQSTLDRVQSQLIRAWSKAKDQAIREPIPPTVATWIQANLAGNDANAAGRVKIIYVKLRMRQQFPMNFAEVFNVPYTNPALAAAGFSPAVPPGYSVSLLPPLQPMTAYINYLTNHGINAGAVSAALTPDPRESAVCLLMALQRGVSGAGINPEDLTSGGAAGDYNGMPYLTDAWSRPIFFSRAPAGNLYLNPAYPAGLGGANDPGDPQGYLQTQGWGTTYGPLFMPLTLQVLAPQNQSYKLAPMIASGGPSNWTKPGAALTFNPVTFAPLPGSDAIFSTP